MARWPPSLARSRSWKTWLTRPIPVRLLTLWPLAVQMPALSCPRCCSAYSAKKARRAGSADLLAIATTPQASLGLLKVGLPREAEVGDADVQHCVNDYP